MKVTKKIFASGLIAVVAILAGCFGPSAAQLLASGKDRLAKGDGRGAMIEFMGALQQDPNLTEARFLLGKSMLAAGDFRGANIELSKARELGYPADELMPQLAVAVLGLGAFEKVNTDFASVKLGVPSAQAAVLSVLAEANVALGQREVAKRYIQEALSVDPKSERARMLKVGITSGDGDRAAALQQVNEILADSATNSKVWVLKGDLLYYGMGNARDGGAAYSQALQLDNKSVGAHSGLIAIHLGDKRLDDADKQFASMQKALPNSAQTRFWGGLIALHRGDIKTAGEQVQAMLRLAPQHPAYLHLAGAVALRAGVFLQAEKYLSQSLALLPNDNGVRLLLAQALLQAGDTQKAISTLQPLVKSVDVDGMSLMLLGQAYVDQGDIKRAEEAFSRAAKLNPGDVRARTALAVSQLEGGMIERGVNELRRISEADSGVYADMALITAHLRRREYAQALHALDVLEKKVPPTPNTYSLRGTAELARGQRDAARKAFETALSLSPSYFPAAASLSVLDVEDRHVDRAIARFERMQQREPDNFRVAMAVIGLRIQAGAKPPEVVAALRQVVKKAPNETQPRLLLVSALTELKDTAGALAAAADAVRANPDSPVLLEQLGLLQASNKEFAQAIVTFGKLAVLQPESPQAHYRLGEVYLKRGETAPALASLKRALDLRPDFLPAQLALGSRLLADKGFQDAKQLARTMQRQRPGNALGYLLEGDAEAGSHHMVEAAQAYRMGLDRKASTELAVKLRQALFASKQNAAAEAMTERWLKQHAGDVEFLKAVAEDALSKGHLNEAMRRFDQVDKLRPNDPAILNNLAWLSMKLGKAGARELAERALKTEPKQAAFLDTLAEINADAGQLEKSIELQRRATENAPESPIFRFRLAQYLIKSGNKAAARTELQALAALGDKYPAQDQVQLALKQVE